MSVLQTKIKTIKKINADMQQMKAKTSTSTDPETEALRMPIVKMMNDAQSLFRIRSEENGLFNNQFKKIFQSYKPEQSEYIKIYDEYKKLHDEFIKFCNDRSNEKAIEDVVQKVEQVKQKLSIINEYSEKVKDAYQLVVDEKAKRMAEKAGGDPGDITISFSPTFIVIVIVLILLLLILHFYFKYRDRNRKLKLKPVEYEDEDSYDGC